MGESFVVFCRSFFGSRIRFFWMRIHCIQNNNQYRTVAHPNNLFATDDLFHSFQVGERIRARAGGWGLVNGAHPIYHCRCEYFECIGSQNILFPPWNVRVLTINNTYIRWSTRTTTRILKTGTLENTLFVRYTHSPVGRRDARFLFFTHNFLE